MLSGSVTFGFNACSPNGLGFNIGLDGGHYIVRADSAFLNFHVACAETNTIGYSRSAAGWQTDVAGLGFGPTGVFFPTQIWPVIGGPYFYAMGCSFWYDNTTGKSLSLGVRYKIVDPSTVVVDGPGICLLTAGTNTDKNLNQSGFVYATATIGSDLLAVVWTGQTLFFGGEIYLMRVPLAGVTDLTPGSWEPHVCTLDNLGDFLAIGTRFYSNKASIISNAVGCEVFSYFTPSDGVGLLAPKLWSQVVDFGTMIATARVDRSADFGIPFAGDGLDFAGGPGTPDDFCTCPTVQGSSVRFLRPYSDQIKKIGMYEFTQVGGVVTSLGLTQFTGTADVFIGTMPQVQSYQEPGVINTFMDDENVYHFGGLAIRPPIVGANRRLASQMGPVRTLV